MFRIGRKQLIWLSHSLATMHDAGLPVTRSLEVAAGQAHGPLRSKLTAARADLDRGASLAEAFERQGGFPPLFLQLVAAGEDSGALERTFGELARYYEFQQRLWHRFLTQISYPAFQYVIAIAVVAFVAYVLGALGQHFGNPALILLFGYGTPVALFVAYRLAVNTLGGARIVHEAVLSLPLLGTVMRRVALARFSLVLYVLSEAATPIMQALTRSFEATGNGAFVARAPQAVRTIEEAGNLTEALRATGLFPSDYLDVMSVAEESGKVGERLNWLARHYAEQSESALRMLSTAVAVVIWVSVAVFIIYNIFLIFSMYLSGIQGTLP